MLVISLPLNLLYTVRLAPKQKLGLAVCFSIGILIILVAIARAAQISRKAFADGVLLALWGIIESTVCEYRHLIAFDRNGTKCCLLMCLVLMSDISFSVPAVIVGCLPPFKSLFDSRGSSQRSKSSVNSKKASTGLKLGVRRLDSAKTSPDTTSRSVDGKGNAFGGGHDGVYDVPHGAIGVRTDYVSRKLGGLRKRVDVADRSLYTRKW